MRAPSPARSSASSCAASRPWGRSAIESDPSGPICITPKDTFPPAPPKGLAAVASTGVINLIWDANTEADLAGYVVLRGEAPGATLQPLMRDPIKETRYTDRTAKPNVRYVYAIVAVDKAGNRSTLSNQVEDARDDEAGRGRRMKIFIDTGNLKEIEKLVPLGIIDGITTNPSLLAKEPGDYRENLKKICQIVQGPTSAEVVETEAEAMIRQGRDLATIDPHIVVKVPLTRDGIKACKRCRAKASRSTSRSASRRRRRCSRPRSARPTSARSSAGSTTSARPAWS